MSIDGLLKIKLKNISICNFWFAAHKEFSELSDAPITYLLAFPLIYLCEQGFSALTSIKTKHRNCHNPEPPPNLATTMIQLQIEVLACQKHA
jgi:hypothetical protein